MPTCESTLQVASQFSSEHYALDQVQRMAKTIESRLPEISKMVTERSCLLENAVEFSTLVDQVRVFSLHGCLSSLSSLLFRVCRYCAGVIEARTCYQCKTLTWLLHRLEPLIHYSSSTRSSMCVTLPCPSPVDVK